MALCYLLFELKLKQPKVLMENNRRHYKRRILFHNPLVQLYSSAKDLDSKIKINIKIRMIQKHQGDSRCKILQNK